MRGALFLHGSAHTGQFLRSGFGHEGGRVHDHRSGGHGGTVGPEAVEQVGFGLQLHTLRCQGLLQLALGRARQHVGGHTDHGALVQRIGQHVHVRADLAQFLQFDAGAGQLGRGLLPVAAVHPDASRGGRNHQRAHRTGEARHPFAAMPVFGHVFGHVGIGRGDDPGVVAMLLHGLTQGSQTLGGGGQGGSGGCGYRHAGFLKDESRFRDVTPSRHGGHLCMGRLAPGHRDR